MVLTQTLSFLRDLCFCFVQYGVWCKFISAALMDRNETTQWLSVCRDVFDWTDKLIWYLLSDKETWFLGFEEDPASTSAGRRSSACTPSSSGRPPPSAATAWASPGQLIAPAAGPGCSSACRTHAGSERRRR